MGTLKAGANTLYSVRWGLQVYRPIDDASTKKLRVYGSELLMQILAKDRTAHKAKNRPFDRTITALHIFGHEDLHAPWQIKKSGSYVAHALAECLGIDSPNLQSPEAMTKKDLTLQPKELIPWTQHLGNVTLFGVGVAWGNPEIANAEMAIHEELQRLNSGRQVTIVYSPHITLGALRGDRQEIVSAAWKDLANQEEGGQLPPPVDLGAIGIKY